MKPTIVMMIFFFGIGSSIVNPASAQSLGRFHNPEHPMVAIAEENSPCGPYFRESSTNVELPMWFQFEKGTTKAEATLEKYSWLIIDNSKVRPTWELFSAFDRRIDIFRFSEEDARKAPCLRAVAASDQDRWFTSNYIAGISEDKICGSFFSRLIPGTKSDQLSFLVAPSDVGIWETLTKKYTWVLIEPGLKFPRAEIFRFQRYRSPEVANITIIRISPENYEISKACLPPLD
jgi:hypothetical protein